MGMGMGGEGGERVARSGVGSLMFCLSEEVSCVRLFIRCSEDGV